MLAYRYNVSFPAGQPLALEGIERFTAVWFRRVKKPMLTLAEAHVAEYVAGELLALLQNLYLLLDCKWVSQPAYIYQAENKLYQLKRAEELGFTPPETLVTNEKSALRDFYHRHQGEVILKPLYTSRVVQGEQQRVLFTNKLKPEHIAQLDLYLLTPSIYQRNIPKAYEVRVTVVSREIFCGGGGFPGHGCYPAGLATGAAIVSGSRTTNHHSRSMRGAGASLATAVRGY